MLKKLLFLSAIGCTVHSMEMLKLLFDQESISSLEEACLKGDLNKIMRCRRAAALQRLTIDKTDLETLKKVLPLLADYENGEAAWFLKHFQINPAQPIENILAAVNGALKGSSTSLEVKEKDDSATKPNHSSSLALVIFTPNVLSPLQVFVHYGALGLFKKELENALVHLSQNTKLAADFEKRKKSLIDDLREQAIRLQSCAIFNYLHSTFGESGNYTPGIEFSIATVLLESKELHPRFLESLLKSFTNRVIPFKILVKLIEARQFDIAIRLLECGTPQPDALNSILIPAVKTCHPGLVAALLKKWGATPFQSGAGDMMPLHHVLNGYINPPDLLHIKHHFRIRKLLEAINNYAPGSYSNEEIAEKPEEKPEEEWTWSQQNQNYNFPELIDRLKREKPTRFQIGLPSEADCLAVMKLLLDKDHSEAAIAPNDSGLTPLMFAGRRPKIMALFKTYYPDRFKQNQSAESIL